MSDDEKKNVIVPFGKYKGQPVEVMMADRPYTDWCSSQSWFADKYANLYQIINYHSGEPTETPEHNALQVLFLDEVFCRKFMKIVFGVDRFGAVNFEVQGIDVLLRRNGSDGRGDGHYMVELKPTVGDDYPAVLRQIKSCKVRNPYGQACYLYGRALFLGEYTGVGATRDQFIKTFEMEGIKVVFQDECMKQGEADDQQASD